MVVDKGTGWGESEGSAIVPSKPIFYRSNPYVEPPTPLELATMEMERKYPKERCK